MAILLALITIASALIGLGLYIGSRLPKTHVAASRIRLQAKPEQIWQILLDFVDYPKWRMGLKRVEVSTDEAGRPMWTEICSEASKITFKVVEAHPPYRLVTQTADQELPLASCWIYTLRPVDGGTELTIIENDRIYHPLFRAFARYIISYHGAIDVFLTCLAMKLGQPAIIEHLQLKHQPTNS